jgi:hypothetical protein
MSRRSAAAYDAECNAAATAAGINDANEKSYIANMYVSASSPTSPSGSTQLSRLGTTARGWMRMDGAPFVNFQPWLV